MDNDEKTAKLIDDYHKLIKALKITMQLLRRLPGYWGDALSDKEYEFMEQIIEEYKLYV